MTSLLNKYKSIHKKLGAGGTRAGSRIHDGTLHELSHCVTLGISKEDILNNRHLHLSWLVSNKISKLHQPDDDEARATAACVHALRKMRCMKDTKKYLKGSFKSSSEAVSDPNRLKSRINKDLKTKASKDRADKIIKLIHELYDDLQ